MKRNLLILLLLITVFRAASENGYECWLRYAPVEKIHLSKYLDQVTELQVDGSTPTLKAAKDEFLNAAKGMLGKPIPMSPSSQNDSA